MPIRVARLDQLNLPAPIPLLDLLLALDSADDAVASLEVDKLLDAIALGEARNLRAFVFLDAPNQVVGDADIERPIAIRSENLDVGWHRLRRAWIPAFAGMTHWLYYQYYIQLKFSAILRRHDKEGSPLGRSARGC
jgi:hypothetical protein